VALAPHTKKRRCGMITPWNIGGGRQLCRSRIPLLMGILNVTPDSFSDGGQYQSAETAVDHALRMIDDGADIIDVGGESTRPGAEPVALDEELLRTIPVICMLASRTDVPVSIDTMKAEVARHAVEAGASIINDVSGLTFDDAMLAVCAGTDVGICLMHMPGTPRTMQSNPCYQDVVREVTEYLKTRVEICVAAGIDRSRLCVDPGIGFGKTADHNLDLLSAAAQMRETLACPMLIGHSRKRFLSRILGRPVDERTAGTIGVSVAVSQRGVDVLRVHDVAAIRDALVAWNAIEEHDGGNNH
jgi:dihydropteroate synthase